MEAFYTTGVVTSELLLGGGQSISKKLSVLEGTGGCPILLRGVKK